MRFDLWQSEREQATVTDHGIRVLTTDTPPTAKLWNPKASKPSANYRFRSVDRRDEYVREFVERYAEHVSRKVSARTQRSAAVTAHASDIQTGAIFRHSWGYDQTNIDYYQVVEKHGQNLTLRAIAQSVVPGSEASMSEHVEPSPGVFLEDERKSKPLAKRLQFTSEGRAYLSFPYGWCEQWLGGSSYQSHYA